MIDAGINAALQSSLTRLRPNHGGTIIEQLVFAMAHRCVASTAVLAGRVPCKAARLKVSNLLVILRQKYLARGEGRT